MCVILKQLYEELRLALQARQKQHVGAQLWRSFARLWEGFECIRASRYLTHLSTYIVLTTAIASLMYFEKSMVGAPFGIVGLAALLEPMCSYRASPSLNNVESFWGDSCFELRMP